MFSTQAARDQFVMELRSSTDSAKQDLAAEALASMTDRAEVKDVLTKALRRLPAPDQREVAARSGLPEASPNTVDRLWLLIVGALLVLIFFLFVLAAVWPQGVSGILELIKSSISLALGAIIGLIAPGVVKSQTR